MFASLKPLFLRLFAGGWTGRDEDAIGQGPRDLVTIDRAELEALRVDREKLKLLEHNRNYWRAMYQVRAEPRFRAITALPDTVRVTRAKTIAREALGE